MSQHFLQADMNCLPVLGHGLQAILHICWEGWGADREPDRSQALESGTDNTGKLNQPGPGESRWLLNQQLPEQQESHRELTLALCVSSAPSLQTDAHGAQGYTGT